MRCIFFDSIGYIDPAVWNSIANSENPFLRHEFLAALEQSGSVSPATGWKPHHLVVYDGDITIAVLPLYLKFHSYGEYIFDFSWANAYQRYGLDYYPKLLSAIPFVPATGIRLAHVNNVDKERLFSFVAETLIANAEHAKISSLHILLADQQEANLWSQQKLSLKITTQFHWHNNNYKHFPDFLETFNSRKRKAVKKERQSIVDQCIEIERLTGTDLTSEHWDYFHQFYQDTYAKRSGHGGYLKREFFTYIQNSMPEQTLIIFAKRNGHYIAGALYFFNSTTLYGRHWGCVEEVEFLHFELCYYQGIDFCIKNNLQKFEAGAQGEHKIQRGFIPSPVYSNHWIADERFRSAINHNISEESQGNLTYIEEMKEFLPFKSVE
ncbi:MAG: N-acetyltransferase [Gammaproteobacteria bacterium]|nr:MAG: N-acetyltransferase [Gammaproteobacteria bacterium]